MTDEFSRGKESGSTETRLSGHDNHFAAINGSIAKFAEKMGAVELLLQSVKDTVKANTEAAIATAAALEKADVARRKKDEEAWSPVTKLFASVAALASIVATYLAMTR